jgi:hypothetical protein
MLHHLLARSLMSHHPLARSLCLIAAAAAAVAQVAERLETAVNSALDQGWRTKDLWKEGTNLVKCSEMGDILNKLVA